MDHDRAQVADEIRAKRLVLVDSRDRPRLIIEMAPGGDAGNGGIVESPRASLLNEKGRPVLVLEVDARGKARIRVGDPDRGAVTEVEPGLVLLGFSGNTRALIIAQEDGGVLHLCDEDGAPVARLPGEE